MVLEVLLAIVGVVVVVVVFAAVLPVLLVRVVVGVLLLDLLWSHLMPKIHFLSVSFTSFPPIFLPSLLCSCILLDPSINCLISFCDTVNTTASSLSVTY